MGWWLYNMVNVIVSETELYALKWLICYVNFTPIKNNNHMMPDDQLSLYPTDSDSFGLKRGPDIAYF